ncbi:lysis protein [Pseudomonas yamanorum]|nr:lysis protein [Pseudomonas yamanorum]
MIRYLIAALVGCLLVIYGGWSHIKEQATELADAKDRNLTLERAAESRRNTQRLLAQLDTEHTKVLIDVQAKNKAQLARIGTGTERLSVPASCPVVRGTTATAGLDDAEARPELDPAAGQRILATGNDGDEAIIALTGLQDYINKFCLGGTSQKGQ